MRGWAIFGHRLNAGCEAEYVSVDENNTSFRPAFTAGTVRGQWQPVWFIFGGVATKDKPRFLGIHWGPRRRRCRPMTFFHIA